MVTFSQAQSRVKSYLLDVPEEAEPLIPVWINDAIRQAEHDGNYNFHYMRATAEYRAEAGNDVLQPIGSAPAKPADWKGRRADPYLKLGDDRDKEIDWAPSESEIIRHYDLDDPQDKGAPQFVLEEHMQFRVAPLPDDRATTGDGHYHVFIPYWRYSVALEESSDTHWLLENADLYVIYYAIAEGFGFNFDEAREQKYAREAAMQLEKARQVDKASRLDRRRELPFRTGVYGPTRRARRRSL